MLATLALTLTLFAGQLGPLPASPHTASPPPSPSLHRQAELRTPLQTELARAAHAGGAGSPAKRTLASRRRHTYGAAARAVEHRLLLVAARSRWLARFVDRSTGLVKLNVTAHCQLIRGLHRPRPSVYLCRVWRQPRLPSSGVRVLCRTKHKRFVVMAYRRRHRR